MSTQFKMDMSGFSLKGDSVDVDIPWSAIALLGMAVGKVMEFFASRPKETPLERWTRINAEKEGVTIYDA